MNQRLQHTVRILRQIGKYRLDLLIPREKISVAPARWLLGGFDLLLPAPEKPRGERLKLALLELGPVFIKLGQLLSTRRDLLPDDLINELANLQDRVPPIPDFDVEQFVSEALAQPHHEVFSELDSTPLASASIAQVHAGRLQNGADVVVKIVRPNIEPVIRKDMQLLKFVADWLNKHVPGADRLHLPQIAQDHERVLMSELNMFGEARNQIQLRRNFAESDLLYVPKVYADYTRANLFVMERVYGIPVGNVEELAAAGVDFKVLADKGVETFFTQVFEDNFFHADMHPGNILIDVSNPANPRYIALDCAIIGSLTSADQNYLAQNLVAFFNRNYRRVVDLHLESGWVPADTNAAEFEEVIRQVCDPIFAKPLAEISFADFIVQLFQTAGQFNMEIQPQLVLLQKTLLYIEGVGRQLYPELDLWETAQPFMQKWTAEHLGPAAVLQDWLAQGPQIWGQLARLPQTLLSTEGQLRQLRGDVLKQQRSLRSVEQHLERQQNHRRVKRAAGAVLIGASTWLLWQPITAGLTSGDATMLAGVISAFLGSALLVRA